VLLPPSLHPLLLPIPCLPDETRLHSAVAQLPHQEVREVVTENSTSLQQLGNLVILITFPESTANVLDPLGVIRDGPLTGTILSRRRTVTDQNMTKHLHGHL